MKIKYFNIMKYETTLKNHLAVICDEDFIVFQLLAKPLRD